MADDGKESRTPGAGMPEREQRSPAYGRNGRELPLHVVSGPRGEFQRHPAANGRPAQPSPGFQPSAPHGALKDIIRPTPPKAQAALDELKNEAKTAAQPDPELEQAAGFTHFDTPSSHDNLITVLLARDDLHLLASQTLVRVKSREDGRAYLGVVVRGPFAEPNAVPANSTMAIGVVTQGKKLTYTFDYHGRAEVELLGEEVEGTLKPPRFRPRPQSPVFILDDAESERVLGVGGDLCLGVVVGYERMEARLNAQDKSILPRHTGIIGTTGGGKSTTVATLIHRAQAAGIATIVFDVEGEYTHVDEPTDHAAMLEALKRRGQRPEGIKDLHVHYLTGRASRSSRRRNLHPFSLNFSSLSPYALAEILDMSDAQQERFLKAYDVTKLLLEDFGIFPKSEEDRRRALDVDELSTGYPQMTIQHVLDVVGAYIYSLSDEGRAEAKSRPRSSSRRKDALLEEFEAEEAQTQEHPASANTHGPMLLSEFKRNPGRVMSRVMAQSSKHEIS